MQLHSPGPMLGAQKRRRSSAPAGPASARFRGTVGMLASAAMAACLALVTPARAAGPTWPSSPTTLAITPTPGDSASSGRYAAYAQHLAVLINEYRAYKGLPPLDLVQDLSALASEHSLKMAQSGRLSHDGFHERFDRTNARICVENVGLNFPHPEAQLDGWRASPGHHRNLLEPKVARMGIARSRTFVTFFACS